jgi:outer membrane murein-binding lipoprotein Lpp
MKMNTHRKNPLGLCLLGAAILATSLLSGCVSKTTKVETGNISLGQQLQDLEKAHQNGTISDKEYKELRKSIIDKYK